MSITDELREYIWQHATNNEELRAIADRIDAEHEKAVQKEFVRVYTSDADMEHDGWIRLPKDADGVPIHIGDRMENLREDFEPPFHHTFRVYGIQYREYGQECTLTEDGYPSIQYRASEVRHHHEPTVEDVLREFGDKYCDMVTGSDKESELFAEYTAKLQLKERE